MKNKIIFLFKRIFLFALRFYQKLVSPFLGSHCRFYPSCSHYAEEAITRRGILSGSWLSFKRLMRCQPFYPGGFDPVE